MTMAVRLGVAPIAWSNDDLPQLGGDTPLEVCLRESKLAGYSGTETGGKFPMDPDKLGPILERHGLELVSGWFSGGLLEHTVDEEMVRMEAQLRTFAALGAPVVVYAETTGSVQSKQDVPVSKRPRLELARYREYGDKLSEVAERMAARGVPMAYHHHMGTVIETEDDVDALMQSTSDSVGLTIDTGHLTFAGASIEGVVRRHAKRIRHVHCKDVRFDALQRVLQQDGSFLDGVLDGVFTVPGDGSIDFDAFCALLGEIGYAGWVVVEAEQDPAKANPLEYATLGHNHLSAALAKAGVAVAD